MHEDIFSVNDLLISLQYLPESNALTTDCFYFSDQEVKMEEAMSHTGIHPFFFSLFSGFFFNTCMGPLASFPLITSHPWSADAVMCGCMLGDELTHRNR